MELAVAAMIKKLRNEKQLSAKQLGMAVGVSDSSISLYESGDRKPPIDMCVRLADFFDVSLDLLVRGKEKTVPIGRSIEEIAKAFKALSDEHLELLAQTALNVLAERRFQARQEKEQKENQ